MDTARIRIYHAQGINHDLVLARLDATPHTPGAVHDEADLERRGTLRLGLRRVRRFVEQPRCLRPELRVGRLARLEGGRCASGWSDWQTQQALSPVKNPPWPTHDMRGAGVV